MSGLTDAPGRDRRGAGRRHPVQARHDGPAGALVRRSQGRRRGRQRHGRQPPQHGHPLAGAGICHRAESGAAGAGGAGRGDGGAGRGGRLAARGAGGAGRLSRRHAGRGPGPDHRHPERRLAGGVRSQRQRLDRGAGHGEGPGQAALPLVVRHTAMPVEAPPHHLQSAAMANWAWWPCRRSGCSRSC